eukprot:4986939-Pyramimonas_sp.AAC.1
MGPQDSAQDPSMSSMFQNVTYNPEKCVYVGRATRDGERMCWSGANEIAVAEKVRKFTKTRSLKDMLAPGHSVRELPKCLREEPQDVTKNPRRTPPNARAQLVIRLMCLLYARGACAKIPLLRAADIAGLRLSKQELDDNEYTGLHAMRHLIVLHQLWTPRRMASAMSHLKARGSMKDALQRISAQSSKSQQTEIDRDEIAMLVPGLCRRITKPSNIVKWFDTYESWEKLTSAAAMCCEYFHNGRGTITTQACDLMVSQLRPVDMVGDYTAPHCVRSLAAIFHRKIALGSVWGSMLMSDRSVAAMLKVLGNPSPVELLEWLGRSGIRNTPTIPDDAGALALLLCETHQVYAKLTKRRFTLCAFVKKLGRLSPKQVQDERRMLAKVKKYSLKNKVYESAAVVLTHMGML